MRGAVTLAVPLLFAEQSLLLSLQHLPRALAVALAVTVVVAEPLLCEERALIVAVACSRKL
jgi:hypothetical protein